MKRNEKEMRELRDVVVRLTCQVRMDEEALRKAKNEKARKRLAMELANHKAHLTYWAEELANA